MDTQILHTTSNRGLVLLTIVGSTLLVISTLLFFDIFDFSKLTDVSSDTFTGLTNTGPTAQIVAMLFWSVLSLLGGVLWLRACTRTLDFVEITVFSLAFSGLVIVLGALIPGFGGINEASAVPLYTLTVLFSFTFIGFLLFIGREILVAAFPQGKK